MRVCDHCAATGPTVKRCAVGLVQSCGEIVREPALNDPEPDLCPKCREQAMDRLLKAFAPPEAGKGAAG